LSTSSFPTHRSSSLSSLLLDADTTLCLLRRSRHIVRPRCRRCCFMLTLLFVYFVVPDTSFVLVVVAVIGCYRTICVLRHFRRHRSSSSSLSSLLFDAILLSVYFVVPEAWFLVVLVVAAVVGGYPTLGSPLRSSIAQLSPRHFSSLGSRIPHHLSRQCREIIHCHCHLRLLIFACHHQ